MIMKAIMAAFDLSDLIAGANEDLGIEFKAWLDTSDKFVRAKSRSTHCCA